MGFHCGKGLYSIKRQRVHADGLSQSVQHAISHTGVWYMMIAMITQLTSLLLGIIDYTPKGIGNAYTPCLPCLRREMKVRICSGRVNGHTSRERMDKMVDKSE